ncbi:LuxR C-terminal-related transcriptional regulator [Nocardia sp. NPDC088792]|uniref:helix-turn-helix transcriptional regulator n=1 Tax=Nocardia sp. NPDC088792 TaxID=3364332 RepID=UPI003803AC84
MKDIVGQIGLDDDVVRVYQAVAQYPDWGSADLSAHLEVSEIDIIAALDVLVDLTLVRRSVDKMQWRVIDQKSAARIMLGRCREELSRLQRTLWTIETTLMRLAIDSESNQPADAERLLGFDSVHTFLEQIATEVRAYWWASTLTAVPSEAMLETILQQHIEALNRGVQLRKIVPDSAHRDRATRRYAASMVETAIQLRVTPTLSAQMVVIDSTIALVPLSTGELWHGALVLRESTTVAALAACFEQMWALSTPFAEVALDDNIGLTVQERQLLRFLAEGMTDDAIAKRLAVSARTARRITANLMQRLGAHSRFEAGFKVARRGWV